MEKHLKSIGKFVADYIKKNQMNTNYVNIITTSVSPRSHSHFEVGGMDDFDDLTVGEVKKQETELHDKIRSYLEKHKIDKTVYFENGKLSSFKVYFRDEVKISY